VSRLIPRAELDLLIVRRAKRFGFELKHEDAPRLTKSMRVAVADLRLDRLFVVHPGEARYQLDGRWARRASSRPSRTAASKLAPRLEQKLRPDAVPLVSLDRASIAANKFGATESCGRSNQRVVCRTASDPMVRQPKDELPVGPLVQPKKGFRKSRLKEFPNDKTCTSVRCGQARQHGVGLERAVLDEAQAAVERSSRNFVTFVP